MGTESPQELLKQWRLEQITVEMATGYILQTLVKACEEIAHLNHSFYKLRTDVDRLVTHTGLPSPQSDKRQCPQKN